MFIYYYYFILFTPPHLFDVLLVTLVNKYVPLYYYRLSYQVVYKIIKISLTFTSCIIKVRLTHKCINNYNQIICYSEMGQFV